MFGFIVIWITVALGVLVAVLFGIVLGRYLRHKRATRTRDGIMADFGLPPESGSQPAPKDAVAIEELDAVAGVAGSASVPDGISADKPADAGATDQPSAEPTILAKAELDELCKQLDRDREVFAKQQVTAEEALAKREATAAKTEIAVGHRELMLAKDVDAVKVREMKLEAAFAKSRAEIAARSDVVSNAVEVVTEREVAVKAREDAVAAAEVALKEREAVVGDAVIAAEAKLATAGQLFDDLDQREADLKQREAVAQREQVSTIPSKDKPEDQPLTRGAKIFLVLVGLAGLAVVGGFAYFLFF